VAVGALAGQVDWVHVPEPVSALLLSVGLVIGLFCFRGRFGRQ
jgi:hypothetical protein